MTFQYFLREIADLRCERLKRREGLSILSLDWDAWTGDRWTDKCCGYCQETTHKIGRGSARERYGQRDFWIEPEKSFKLNIYTPAIVIVSECHADLGHIITPADLIVNIDAHADNEDQKYLCCGSWAYGSFTYVHYDRPTIAHKQIKKHVDDFRPDFVYMCLSSPWTPKNTDHHFFKFVKYIASKCIEKEPIFFGHRKSSLENRYSRYTGDSNESR